MASRRLAREHALQILFQLDMTGDDAETGFDLHWRGREVDEATRAFAERVVRGAVADAVRIDVLIREASENWRLERMANVDRNVLRVAIYELLHESDTPPAVIIDEAIEIAKRFGGGVGAVRQRRPGRRQARVCRRPPGPGRDSRRGSSQKPRSRPGIPRGARSSPRHGPGGDLPPGEIAYIRLCAPGGPGTAR